MSLQSWDIFCRVIDNFGDIGVSWRLARQLATAQRAPVRLWIGDLKRLHALCPSVDPDVMRQHVLDVDVCRWDAAFPDVEPAQVVVEMFGCGLPDPFVEAMAHRQPPPLWIVIEYLSAEPWVNAHHGLPSPHPRWVVPRFFFFPGFVSGTGGVLRESDLLARRDAFDAHKRASFWDSLGFDVPAVDAIAISLFAYDQAPVEELIDIWANGTIPVVTVIPEAELAARIRTLLRVNAESSATLRNLELRFVPFLPQPQYDELLWACDINFVRGEDSFVRAQWAGRPFIWHIYPQQEHIHWVKLEAFLTLYCADMPSAAAQAMRDLWRSWNLVRGAAPVLPDAWQRFIGQREALRAQACAWEGCLANTGDLAGNLVKFCQNRL